MFRKWSKAAETSSQGQFDAAGFERQDQIMPVEVAKSKVDRVLQEIAQFTPHQLERVIQNASILRVEKLNLVMPSRESELLEIINRGLANQKQARIAALRDKLENENITPREHAQLIKLSEEVEKLAAERLQALLELAEIRKSLVGLSEKGRRLWHRRTEHVC